MRAAAALPDLADDASGHVVAREQLGRPARALVALRVAEPFLFAVGGLAAIVFRDVVEEEPLALAVEQHSAFAAHALGDEDALHGGRPDHPGGMELHELHVHQFGAGVVREHVAVAGVLPGVAGDLVGLAHSPGGEDDRPGAEHMEEPALPVIPERAGHPLAVLEQREHRVLHVHVDALVDAVVLKRADHLQPRAIADVREARIAVPAEVALEDAAVLGAIEEGAPGLQLAHARRRFLRVQLGHPPGVQVLAAAHGVGEVDLPVVALVDVGQRRRDPALRHHRVRLSQERLAHQPDREACRRGLDGCTQPGSSRADHQHVVLVGLGADGQTILQSRQTPIEQSRM